MMRPRAPGLLHLLVVSAAWLLLCPVSRAVAQDEVVEPDGARERAQPIFERGIGLVGEQRWAEALEAFQEAQQIYPSPILDFNIAYCQRALGHFVLALDGLQAFLAEPLAGVAATREQEARDLVRELTDRIAHLTVRVPEPLRGAVELLVDGRDATLDDSGALAMRIDPGHHTVRVRHDGYVPLFWDRDVAPGETAELDVDLHRLPGELVVTANIEGAVVEIDGEEVGTVPYQAEIEASRLQVVVRSPGYVAHRSNIEIAAGETTTVEANLSPEPVPIRKRWWFWSAIVAGLAGAAVATWVIVRPEPQPPPYDGGSLNWVVCVDPAGCP